MAAVLFMTLEVCLKMTAMFLVAAVQALFAAARRITHTSRSKRDSLYWNCLRPGG
jgi:hypothetical protein